MLFQKLTGMAKDKGIQKVIIDITKPELELQEVEPNQILVDETTHNFLLAFYNQHKNLINGNQL
jgi:hypothetical protein